MINTNRLIQVLKSNVSDFHSIVSFDKKKDKIVAVDLSKTNTGFTEEIYADDKKFDAYINQKRKDAGATYLIGGYKEERQMYRRSSLFDKNIAEPVSSTEEPRSLHLGTDIWGDAGTKIFAAFGGMVHSYAYNNNLGDYGATIIMQHQLETVNFYVLYGHLALKNLENLRKGKYITRGECFASFGNYEENGNWPPHLHLQLIADIGMYEGDYPGVCKMSEAEKYLHNCPDPDLILQLNRFITPSL
ncbi:MAG: peptidoglycan DD-metalloendopeptidase family protein [Bacteroidetes bacterium]|nr:peptidoglycan DD-metalloendopeptidase family protein [Bacteroidota bacterium]MBS1758403.1 peptidoglycan DD-metalloendopeptidase family protein [Bacteroidota bacterium]